MPKFSVQPKTRAEVLASARAHLYYFVGRAKELQQDVAEEEAKAALGMAMIEAALAVEPGGLFPLWPWMAEAGYPESEMKRAAQLMPYISGGNLRLLEMEFAHADLGIVPLQQVQILLETQQPLDFQGVTLTTANVKVQFRRERLADDAPAVVPEPVTRWQPISATCPLEGVRVLAHWAGENKALADYERWACCCRLEGLWVERGAGEYPLDAPTYVHALPTTLGVPNTEPPDNERTVLAYFGNAGSPVDPGLWALCYYQRGLWYEQTQREIPRVPPVYWQDRPMLPAEHGIGA